MKSRADRDEAGTTNKRKRAWTFVKEVGKTGWIGWLLTLAVLYFAIANYNILSRGDRANVKPTGADLGSGDPSKPELYQWKQNYENTGSQDATRFKLILGTIDSRTGKTEILGTPHIMAKMETKVPQHHYFSFSQNNFFEFYLTCFIYDDDRGHHSEPTFYAMQEPKWKNGVRPVTSQEQDRLSGFSCVQMEK